MPPKTSKSIKPFLEIDKLLGRSIEPSGPEWFTHYDYAQHSGISRWQSMVMLDRLCEKGKIEKWVGSGISQSGQKRTIKKYRLK